MVKFPKAFFFFLLLFPSCETFHEIFNQTKDVAIIQVDPPKGAPSFDILVAKTGEKDIDLVINKMRSESWENAAVLLRGILGLNDSPKGGKTNNVKHKNSFMAHFLYALCLEHQSRYSEAYTHFQKAQEFQGNSSRFEDPEVSEGIKRTRFYKRIATNG